LATLGTIAYDLEMRTGDFLRGGAAATASLEQLSFKFETTAAKAAVAGEVINRFTQRTGEFRVNNDFVSRSLGDLEQYLTQIAPAAEKAEQSQSVLRTSSFSLIGALAPLIVSLGVLAGALAGVAAVVTVFVVAMAGTIAVLTLTFGALAAVGAAVAVLGTISAGGVGAAENLTKAQAQVASATKAHESAVAALQRAQLAGGPTHTFTAAQTLTLHQAQANAASSAGAMAVAQRNLTAAQIAANGPLPTLLDHLKKMADVLGKEAAPMAAVMIRGLDSAVPSVQALGQSLIQWFGGRLPEIMRLVADASTVVSNGFDRLGTAIGVVVDDTLAHIADFEPLIQGAFDGVIDATISLIGKLLELSDWFVINLPTYGPIVSQIFSAIGTIVQGVVAQFLRFSDWTVANWPNIVRTLQIASDVLGTIGDMLGFLGDHLNVVIPLVATLATVWALWNIAVGISNIVLAAHNGIVVIGNAIKIVAAAVTWAVTAAQWAWNFAMMANPIGLLILGILALIVVVILIVTHWNQVVHVLGQVWNWLQQVLAANAWLQVVLTVLLGPIVLVIAHWNQVIGVLGQVWNQITHVGDAFSWLGNLANGLAQTVGGAFSVFSKAVHDALWNVAHAVDQFDAAVDRLPGLSGFLPTNLEAFAGGGIVARAAIVGEDGSGYPEYVIPTNPAYRSNALALTRGLIGSLGLMAGGGVLGAFTDPILGAAHAAMGALGPIGGLGVAIVNRLITTVTDKLGQAFASFAGGSNMGADVIGWIMQAILLTGVPSWWAGGLATIISRESGGNPRAINNWDINAIRGDPSRGLMQTIGGTFSSYHWPGTSWDIYDPVANIAAGINYILHRYGSITNVQQANPSLPPQGYDTGGVLPPGLTLAYNGTGAPEHVLSGTQMAELIDHMRALRRKLLGQVVVNQYGPQTSPSAILSEATRAAFGEVA
jgi:hypothetical protein